MKFYEIKNYDEKKITRECWENTNFLYYDSLDQMWKDMEAMPCNQSMLSSLLTKSDWIEYTPLKKEPTKEEIFFEQVKGKQVRWSGWSKARFMVPHDIKGTLLVGRDNCDCTVNCPVDNGFETNIYGRKWEFYEEPTFIHEFLYVNKEPHSMGWHWDDKVRFGEKETLQTFEQYKLDNQGIKVIQELKVNQIKE